MKEQYDGLELKVVKFDTEDTILMSGLDNDGDTPPVWGGVPD